MESLKAVPTEYRGIRYRSKSEAMFARWLELNGSSLAIGRCGLVLASGFDYEPYGLAVDDTDNQGRAWLVDFLYWNVVSNINDTATYVPIIHYSLIEYKPSRQTQTYLNSLGKKFEWLKQHNAYLVSSRFYCFYGSVFNESRDILTYKEGAWSSSGVDWLAGSEDDILSIRFDLEGAGCHALGR